MARRFLTALVVVGAGLLSFPLHAESSEAPDGRPATPRRLLSLGGSVTEIIYALGAGNLLVGNDLSSVYPPEATSLPRVGYYRALSVEGVLSLMPDLVLASENAGPPAVLDRIRSLGIPVETVSDGPGLESLTRRIRQIAQALGENDRGEWLVDTLQASLAEVRKQVLAQGDTEAPRRALVLMKHSDQYQMAGRDTTAAAVLRLAGLEIAASHNAGFRPVSAEGLLALDPDLIIVTSASLDNAGGMSRLLASPGIALMRAAKQQAVIVIDDALILGMGPRVPEAVLVLHEQSRKGVAP